MKISNKEKSEIAFQRLWKDKNLDGKGISTNEAIMWKAGYETALNNTKVVESE